MSGLCLVAAVGAVLASLPAERLTLAWNHSVEKIRWEETYTLRGGQLWLVTARVRGSGAGMEVPEGARWNRGAWEYRTNTPLPDGLTLAASSHGGDYEVCFDGRCRKLRELAPAEGPVSLRPCP